MMKIILIIIFVSLSIFPKAVDSTEIHGPFLHNKISLSLSMNANNLIVLSSSDNNRNLNVMPSFGIGIEYFFTKHIDGNNTGIGAEYQFKNTIPNVNGHYSNFPIYVFYDISLGKNNFISVPKICLKLGYNFLLIDDNFLGGKSKSSNGIYYALGFSSQLNKHFMIRVLYSVNQGKINNEVDDYLLRNEKINIGFYILF